MNEIIDTNNLNVRFPSTYIGLLLCIYVSDALRYKIAYNYTYKLIIHNQIHTSISQWF